MRTPNPGALPSNPAILTGAAGLMAQLAMKQTMDEITDYLRAMMGRVSGEIAERAQRQLGSRDES